jgi:hypothetical protein
MKYKSQVRKSPICLDTLSTLYPIKPKPAEASLNIGRGFIFFNAHQFLNDGQSLLAVNQYYLLSLTYLAFARKIC